MALQQRNILSENPRIKADAGKLIPVSRPALRPIVNCNVPAKPVTRLAVKSAPSLDKTKTSTISKATAVVKPTSVAKATKVTCKTSSQIASKTIVGAVKRTAGTASIFRKTETEAVKISEVTRTEVVGYSSLLNNVVDIDKDDTLNPLLAPPYANDIYAYLRELERRYPVRRAFLTGQSINGSMRALLLNWIVEVHEEFRMVQESLQLTIGIFDRFVQDFKTIDRTKLQLVGATCLFIAGKYEELFGPDICDLAYTTQGACTTKEILEMECTILSALDFNLGKPLPIHFLRRFSKAAKVDAVQHHLAKYIVELGILDYTLCHHHPSVIAAAALYLTLWLFSGERTLSEKLWTDTLAFYSTYKFSDISHLVKCLSVILVRAETSKHQAVRNKYSSSKCLKVSQNEVLKSKNLKRLSLFVVH